MSNLLRHIAAIMLAVVPLLAHAVETQHDTVYFYNTWEQMSYFEPISMLQDPFIYAKSPLQIFFEIEDEKWNSVIEHDFLGASMGDSIWFINSNYLKKHFDGDVNLLKGYIPLSFNDKVAYFRYGGYVYGERTYNHINWHYYYIDFEHRKVLKVNHNVLSDLLKDYHDLQMRYEGMKDYKKDAVIEDYFLRFIDRISSDPMWPDMLDVVDDAQ